MTPADWLTHARIDRVRELLESTTLSVSDIAARTGLGTPSTLRHHFRKRLGLSPVAYRLQFSIPARGSDGNLVESGKNHH
jgi:AraC family transcriptional activator FtrA